MRYQLLALLFAFSISNCKLDTPDMSNTGSAGTADGYQPTTKGSTWTYHQVYTPGPTMDETMTMTGDHTTINGKTYYAATDKTDSLSGTTYFYHGNDSYSIRSTIIGFGNTVEYLYLKDNIAAGQTWTAPVTDDGKLAGFPAQIIGKVLNSDTTMTLSGNTFKNVSHSQLLLQYNITGAFETYQVIDFYVAKNVGIIEIDTDAGQPNNQKSHETLTSYKVQN